MSKQQGNHFFLLGYQGQTNQCSIVISLPDPLITSKRLASAKESLDKAEEVGGWVLMSVSPLGYMSREEFDNFE